jgi:uncharacterized protein YjbI with pentapeptide repeats
LLQIIVGAAGSAALYFTWANYQLGREGRKSDNFIKAVDQLGHAKVHTRVGGIFGLGRLLRTATTRDDYWAIMDVLTAYLRESSSVGKEPAVKTEQDLQAVIDVLARRSENVVPSRENEKNSPVDLSQTALDGLWMANGHFESGFFRKSTLIKTELQGAHLKDAWFHYCNLQEASFEGATAERAEFRWVANANGAIFKGATLTEAKFESSNLAGAHFEYASLENANFIGADLTNTKFMSSNLLGANLDGAIVVGADFSKADMNPDALSKAMGDASTILPEDMARPSHWPLKWTPKIGPVD